MRSTSASAKLTVKCKFNVSAAAVGYEVFVRAVALQYKVDFQRSSANSILIVHMLIKKSLCVAPAHSAKSIVQC